MYIDSIHSHILNWIYHANAFCHGINPLNLQFNPPKDESIRISLLQQANILSNRKLGFDSHTVCMNSESKLGYLSAQYKTLLLKERC